jgi:hypothetical protein
MMRTITARFPKACASCGKPVFEGHEARYEDSTKKIWHPACAPAEQAELPDGRAEQLADKLGFIHYDQSMGADGLLRRMSRRTGIPAAWREES